MSFPFIFLIKLWSGVILAELYSYMQTLSLEQINLSHLIKSLHISVLCKMALSLPFYIGLLCRDRRREYKG